MTRVHSFPAIQRLADCLCGDIPFVLSFYFGSGRREEGGGRREEGGAMEGDMHGRCMGDMDGSETAMWEMDWTGKWEQGLISCMKSEKDMSK